MTCFIHERAAVDEGAAIGDATKVWINAHICSGALIGNSCNIGQNVYIDNGTRIGNNCKIQNNVNVYRGVVLEDYVFCGPSMTFTNVKTPRCLYPREVGGDGYFDTLVCYGASIGAQAVVVCGTRIGRHAMVGSGSVVTKDVLDHALVVGNPAHQIGWVCECGENLANDYSCSCGRRYVICSSGLQEA